MACTYKRLQSQCSHPDTSSMPNRGAVFQGNESIYLGKLHCQQAVNSGYISYTTGLRKDIKEPYHAVRGVLLFPLLHSESHDDWKHVFLNWTPLCLPYFYSCETHLRAAFCWNLKRRRLSHFESELSPCLRLSPLVELTWLSGWLAATIWGIVWHSSYFLKLADNADNCCAAPLSLSSCRPSLFTTL